MSIVCGMDGNGHYRAAKLEEREKVIDVLMLVDDGGFWDDLDEEVKKQNFNELSEKEWLEFVTECEQRGRMEIVKI